MMSRKFIVLSVLLFGFLLILPLVSAELKIKKNAVVDVVIPELGMPATYDLEITNLGKGDNFKIYSLVGVNIKPEESFFIGSKQTKKLRVELYPEQTILNKPGTFNFVYKIKSDKGEIYDDVMLIKIVNLKNAIEINCYNINLDSENAVIYAKNKVSLPFPEIEADFHSAFFDFSRNFSLDVGERKEFSVPLNKEKIKELVAGSYIITTDIKTYGVSARIEDNFRFTEKQEIATSETKSGFLISTLKVEKKNEGNLPEIVQVRVEKNVISRLFTNFNIEPSKVERRGFVVRYIFQKEIQPNETYVVKATTNWLYPLILLIFIITLIYLIKTYATTDIILRKRVSFVKTKGGEFALKVMLIVKARKFVEKIVVRDKIPPLVKVHERFGIHEPDKIDERNRRLEWNLESLQAGEERIFSYIIYSKVSPVGKFELPRAVAIFEKEGKIHESSSNRVFFITEPKRKD